MKGPHSEVTKQKIREKRKMQVFSFEARRKMSESQSGNRNNAKRPEIREKIRLSKLGKKRAPFSEQTRKNMSLGHIGMKGIKSNAWKGGISPLDKRIRSSSEMKLWRKTCLERDYFTCQKTGQKGGRLVIHHINNFADFPELRFVIGNGITLSEESHKLFHKIYGKKNNTREQLAEFLLS